MKINTKQPVKITIIGMQGAGKTEFAKKIIRQFNKPLVYGIYPFEWKGEPDNVKLIEPRDFTIKSFNEFAGRLIEAQNKEKVYDALFIDDADLFFTNNYDIFENINRLVISQRQLGLSLIFISKRPQNLSTKIYENSDYLVVFAVEGVNVKKYLFNLHETMDEMLPKLSREKHNFILKQVGSEPRLYSKARIRELATGNIELKGGKEKNG